MKAVALRLLILGLVVSAATSCSTSKTGDLSLTFGGTQTFLIPASASSCTAIGAYDQALTSGTSLATDISAKFFQVSRPQLHWKNTSQDLFVSYISIKFSDADIAPQECTIAGVDLQWLFATGTGAKAAQWSTELARAGSPLAPTGSTSGESVLSVFPDCNFLKCGGFTVTPNAQKSFVGQVKVVGYSQDSAGNDTPVSYETSITVVNTAD